MNNRVILEKLLKISKNQNNIIEEKDPSEVIYGQPVPEDSNPKLDFALQMLAFYEKELADVKRDRTLDNVNRRNFISDYSDQIRKYKMIVQKISGIEL